MSTAFDLIVIGGGIHGLCTAIRAGEAGRRVVLVERDRVGSGASKGWFRILHGGLRYLQTLDVARLRESVRARRWFIRGFPDQIHRQSFLMPLYNRGLKRPDVFRAAFLAETLLAAGRNRGVRDGLHFDTGQVLTADAVVARYPGVDRAGLRGGALWNEATVPDDTALVTALVARALRAGVILHEGWQAEDLITTQGAVRGLCTRQRNSGAQQQFDAPCVINQAGAWAGALADKLGGEAFPGHVALAFNLLFDLPAPSRDGLALMPPAGQGDMLYLYPDGGRCFAGTRYVPLDAHPGDHAPAPDARQIADFLDMLNAAAPGLGARPEHVCGVTHGLLPVRVQGGVDLLKSDLIIDHGRAGGPGGFFSVRSIKYTTAPVLAARVLARAGLTRARAPETGRPIGGAKVSPP
ncbi:MAG: FAD-dependent oxidoreductase [Marinibacterium sp.]|nr:FAD-dependent oxidoreductase [Marinibacterium sp.]